MPMYEFVVKQRLYKIPTRAVLAIHATRTVRSPLFLWCLPVLLVLADVGITFGGGVLQVAALLVVSLVMTLMLVTADQMRSMILSGVHLEYIACVVQTTKAGDWVARRYSIPAE